MEEVVSLIIPFIALAILSVMIDKLTLVLEAIMEKIPKLPNKFEWFLAYMIVLGLSFIVCWQGNFNLFIYLGVYFNYEWQGFLMTALVISGGSIYVKSNFEMIESIPNAVRGVSATVRGLFGKSKSRDKSSDYKQYDPYNNYDRNEYDNYNQNYNDRV